MGKRLASWRGAATCAVVTAFLLAPTRAGALATCVGKSSGFGFAIVTENGIPIVYRVASEDQRWLLQPLGWHANSSIWCRNCGGPPTNVVALIWLGVAANNSAKPGAVKGQDYPRDVTPWPQARYERAIYIDDPRQIAVGGLSGWLSHLAASSKGVVTHDIFIVDAQDGCGGISLHIETSHAANADSLVTELIGSLRITRRKLADDPALRHFQNKPRSTRIWPVPAPPFETFRREMEKLR